VSDEHDKTRPKFLPGHRVRIGDGEIAATVMSCELWAEGLWRYQLVWWTDGNRHCATFDEWEIVG
jgi:hypothetical protein